MSARQKLAVVSGPNPSAEQVRDLRAKMALTQTEFGMLLYASMRAVQGWEGGQRRMPRLEYEIACLLHMYPGLARLRKRWRQTLQSKRTAS